MDSVDEAVCTGYVCRLCFKTSRSLIHMYGELGLRMRIARINTYLAVRVSPNDPLPKTLCEQCVQRLETHHEFVQQGTSTKKRYEEAQAEGSKKQTKTVSKHKWRPSLLQSRMQSVQQ